MASNNNELLSLVDETTRLVGSNKMELLLFSLGHKEIYGINVFKVREVCEAPSITRTPNMPRGVEGITSLRGSIIPVINIGGHGVHVPYHTTWRRNMLKRNWSTKTSGMPNI